MALRSADSSRRAVIMLSSLLVSTSIAFAGVPVATADPIDDDTSTEAVDVEPEAVEPAPEPEAPEPEAPEPQAPEPDAPAADEPDPGAPEPAGPQQESPGAEEPGNEPNAGEPAPNEPSAPENPAPDNSPGTSDAPPASEQRDIPDEDPINPDLNVADAPDADARAAETGNAVEVNPAVASTAEIDDLRDIVDSQIISSTTSSSSSTTTSSSWSQSVTSWSSSWVGYDTYYRPIIINPYDSPLQVIYTYDNAPRIVTVNPLQRVVVDAKTPGVYSFTALTMKDPKTVSTASVGSFSGGGYKPAPGQPPPAKPAAPKSFENVLVQLRYTTGNSKPFRVKKLYDLGDDPSVGGARRVLLDGEVPAWGQWAKTTKGEDLFAITKTEQLPGLSAPAEGPLPGYKVQLLANEESSKPSVWDGVWIWVGIATAGVVVAGGIVFAVLTARRRRVQ
ncbi:hypothetical protein [Mycolicibacterium komossense]|uniref:Uncharacterized protein n=1 Tax=Mycolicibacterium komossense TaxID=1779 RepID=A0ABT3CCM8_9MYCO|nr:hypothetical protein [Mycolicibacterium komossense]MCV7227259.1 hypothetical protein [Mycolicibacterium komossense]